MRLVRFSGAEPFCSLHFLFWPLTGGLFHTQIYLFCSSSQRLASRHTSFHLFTYSFLLIVSHADPPHTRVWHIYFLFSWCDPFSPSPTPLCSRLHLSSESSGLPSLTSSCPGSLFREGLLVRKSAKVAGGIIGARVGVQTHGCWAWGDQVASQGFPGPRGRRGWAWTKGWGRQNRGQRPSPAAHQPERTHFRHPETLCGLDGVWELPVGHPDLDNQLRHVQGLLNRTIF